MFGPWLLLSSLLPWNLLRSSLTRFFKHLFAGHEVLLVRLPGVLHPGEHGVDVAGPRAALPLGPLRPIAASQSVCCQRRQRLFGHGDKKFEPLAKIFRHCTKTSWSKRSVEIRKIFRKSLWIKNINFLNAQSRFLFILLKSNHNDWLRSKIL